MSIEHEFLHGAEQIAAFLGVSKRRAYYLLETGSIPAARIGAIWTARRSRILKHMEDGEAETLARGRQDAEAG